jgi:hypothetical protein
MARRNTKVIDKRAVRLRVFYAIVFPIFVLGTAMLAARFIAPRMAGVIIAAMSGFATLSSAFGFQILSLRREVRRTEGLDEERRTLLRRRLDRSVRTLFLRWSLSFSCGILGTAFGLVVREAQPADKPWFLIGAGLSLCSGSIFFLVLMVIEYRSLLHFATELEDRAEEIAKKREWAERMGKVAKR